MSNAKKHSSSELAFDESGCAIVPKITSQDVIEFREKLKLTQEEFAERFDIPLATLRNWEQGRSEPVISQARLTFYNMVFSEKARVVRRVESRTVMKKAA